jgi:hypothetical protein
MEPDSWAARISSRVKALPPWVMYAGIAVLFIGNYRYLLKSTKKGKQQGISYSAIALCCLVFIFLTVVKNGREAAEGQLE